MTAGVSDDRSSPDHGPDRAAVLAEAEAGYREIAAELADALDGAIVGWLCRVTAARLPDDFDADRRRDAEARIARTAEVVRSRVAPKLRSLLAADVEAQAANPLGLLRGCVGPAGAVLAELGVSPPGRDPVEESLFPDDTYGLGPAAFDDVDPGLHDLGLTWGAAKAHVILLRHHT